MNAQAPHIAVSNRTGPAHEGRRCSGPAVQRCSCSTRLWPYPLGCYESPRRRPHCIRPFLTVPAPAPRFPPLVHRMPATRSRILSPARQPAASCPTSFVGSAPAISPPAGSSFSRRYSHTSPTYAGIADPSRSRPRASDGESPPFAGRGFRFDGRRAALPLWSLGAVEPVTAKRLWAFRPGG